MASEKKITGQKYRVWDSVSSLWKRLSFWTKASDVEFDSGNTLQTKQIKNLNSPVTGFTYNNNIVIFEIGDVVHICGKAVPDNGVSQDCLFYVPKPIFPNGCKDLFLGRQKQIKLGKNDEEIIGEEKDIFILLLGGKYVLSAPYGARLNISYIKDSTIS